MKNNRKSTVPYAVTAIILIAILAFAGIRALMLYIPQSNESQSFARLKEETGVKDISAEALEDETGSNPSSGGNRQPVAAEDGGRQPGDGSMALLAQKNSDFAGWLSIGDTAIDYPVMKSSESDPEYYLHRDFDKNDSFSGSLFIGQGCNTDSDIFVIYGHNMNAGTMFGSLDSYHADRTGRLFLYHSCGNTRHRCLRLRITPPRSPSEPIPTAR